MTRLTRELLSLRRIRPGRGAADAPRVWLSLWARVRWKHKRAEAWPGDRLLAEETGLCVRRVQRALLLLERSGLITRKIGKPFGARKVRRVIELAPGISRDSQPKILPPTHAAEQLLADVGDIRERPSAAISMFWVIYACAQMNGGAEAHVTLACLKDMTGLRSRDAVYDQLDDLARVGLIEKVAGSWAEGIRVIKYVRQALPLAPAQVVTMVHKMPAQELPAPRLRRVSHAVGPPPIDWGGEWDPGVWEAIG